MSQELIATTPISRQSLAIIKTERRRQIVMLVTARSIIAALTSTMALTTGSTPGS
jgi:hypothetical protein